MTDHQQKDSGNATAVKVIAVAAVLIAAVTWSLQVLFALTLEKALASVVLGTVAIIVLLLATGLSPF